MKFPRITRALAVSAALAVVVPLAACSTGGSSSAGTAADPTPISWWTWDANQAISYQKCATQFNKDNPTIKVSVSNYDWNDYWTKITAGFVSGTAPDTFMDHTTYYPTFANKHELMPLGKYVKTTAQAGSAYTGGIKSFTFKDGKVYGIPKDTATIAFFYNEADAKAAGITDQRMRTMTWNPKDGGTFGQIVKKLSVDDKGVHGDQPGFDKNNVKTYGIGPMSGGGNNGQDTFSGFAASTGWTLGNKANYPTQYNYAQPDFTNTLDYLRSLSSDGYSPKQGVFTNAVEDQIGSGKIAMVYDATSDVVAMSSIKGVKVAMAPGVIGPKGRSSLINSNADSMSAGTKHPVQAGKWLTYLDSEKCQALAGADASFFPVLPKALDVTYASLEKKGIDTTVLKNLYAENKFFTSPVTLGGVQMDNALTPMWSDYFGFKKNASVFDQMQTTSKQVLAAANGN